MKCTNCDKELEPNEVVFHSESDEQLDLNRIFTQNQPIEPLPLCLQCYEQHNQDNTVIVKSDNTIATNQTNNTENIAVAQNMNAKTDNKINEDSATIKKLLKEQMEIKELLNDQIDLQKDIKEYIAYIHKYMRFFYFIGVSSLIIALIALLFLMFGR